MYATYTLGGDFSQDWEFGIMFRSNFLDRLVCMIRDNFTYGTDNIGQAVFPNGTKYTPTEFRGQVRASTLAKFKKVSAIEKKFDDFTAELSRTVHFLQRIVQKRSINH